MTKWTPCNIRQPDKDGWYLVTTHTHTVRMSYYKHGVNRNTWVMGPTKPVAWTELPAPYKEAT